jgi:hypothetical protein
MIVNPMMIVVVIRFPDQSIIISSSNCIPDHHRHAIACLITIIISLLLG